MKKPNYSIRIDTPCNEGWHNMTQSEKGRFCSRCAKQVVDLSRYTDAEIIHLLDSQPGKLCGRLHQSQLNRSIQRPVETHKHLPLSKLAAGLLLMSSATIANPPAKAPNINTALHSDFEADIAQPNKTQPGDTIKDIIRGKVIDAHTKEGIPFMNVHISNTQKGATTNVDGEFVLDVSGEFINDAVTIELISIDYERAAFIFKKSDMPLTKTFTLKPSPAFLEGDLVIIEEPVKKTKRKKK